MPLQRKTYLKGLNGIRAIAALSILSFHLNGQLNTPYFNLLERWNYGVTFFFALSGFLITYLLLIEKKQKYTVSTKQFFLNRVYRILPLYFFYFTFIFVYQFYSDKNLINCNYLYYLFFFANVPFLLDKAANLLGHYWSLGTEEQFYILWPYILNKSKRILHFFIIAWIIFTLIKLIARGIDSRYNIPLLTSFFQTFAFDNMLIGAIGAYLFVNKKSLIEKYFFSFWVQLILLVIFCLLFASKFHIASIVDNQIVSIATVLLIFNTSSNPKTIFKLENPILVLIGKISFGIYIYHPFIIHIILPLILKKVDYTNTIYHTAFVYFMSTCLTLVVSWISFVTLEKYFLKFKNTK